MGCDREYTQEEIEQDARNTEARKFLRELAGYLMSSFTLDDFWFINSLKNPGPYASRNISESDLKRLKDLVTSRKPLKRRK